MQIENQKLCLNVRQCPISRGRASTMSIFPAAISRTSTCRAGGVNNVNLAGLKISNANLAGASLLDARLEGTTIEGISVTEMLAYWRAGHRGGRSHDPSLHIAQLNIGRFRFPTDDPRMAGFMENLDRVNALAERSEGFVWRLKDDTNNATAIPAVSRSRHGGESVGLGERRGAGEVRLEHRACAFLQRQGVVVRQARRAAFRHVDDPGRAYSRRWRRPRRGSSICSAHGDSDHAFGWAHLPHIKLWMTKKCG